MSNIQQQRMVVEQLRREASIKRISVSQAVEDIKVGKLIRSLYLREQYSTCYLVQKFVLDSQCSDCLLLGFSSERANPYREKTWSCQIIQNVSGHQICKVSVFFVQFWACSLQHYIDTLVCRCFCSVSILEHAWQALFIFQRRRPLQVSLQRVIK